ncbi:MAG TPA: asparagine synthase (glutamine-hydrolyzing) [Holophagaceae bacterium]|nr:asparagine synthase (glutamine-hydrolyzing) [Holophagaceae bacterium]
MCGIAGIFAYHLDAPQADGEEVQRMLDAMASRGPDGEGKWADQDGGRIAFGHRRLSILDLSDAGAQPMLSPDGRLALTFNGEIYNFRELKRDLETRGHRFRSNSDSEVLLALWDAHGTDMVHHLRGMYAFALWDAGQQCLFLARDPFGIKPLYMADDGRTLRFASQVKALMAGGGISTGPDLAAWAGFYLVGYVPEPHTIHQAIRALPAGEAILIHRDKPSRRITHFDLTRELQAAEDQALRLPLAEAQARLQDALRGSVRAHLVSDVPVGLFLSAGLDSSTLAALSAEESPEMMRAITLGFREFQGTPDDEVPLAAVAAQHAGIDHAIRWITKDDFTAHFDKALAAMDQPSIDGINTYFVSLAAHQAGMKVAISGLGGDELLAGYPSFRQVPRMARALAPLARLHAGKAARQALSLLLPRRVSPKWAGLLEYGTHVPGAYLLRRSLFMPWKLPEVLGTEDAARALEELNLLDRLAATIEGLKSDRARLMALEMRWYMSGQLLKDSDWASMAHGLEIRVPMVDLDLFRALAPIQAGPSPLGKKDLITCPEQRLPDSITHRSKTGFTTPIRAWAGTRAQSARGLRGWAQTVADPHPSILTSGPGKRILVLLTDAYGGHGGIAQYLRDLLEALCAHPDVREVVALPRIMPHRPGPLPGKLTWVTTGLGGKTRYSAEVVRTIMQGGFDLVLCGHLNLLPLAELAATWLRAPSACFIYGIDAWTPTPSRVVNMLARTRIPVVSISDVTLSRFQAWSGQRNRKDILPNAIRLEDYGAGPKPDGLLDRYGLNGKKVILTFGRMDRKERYKGFDEVLEALPALRKQIPEVVCLLAGDGDDQVRLLRKTQELGIADAVVFTGRVAGHEKADHFRLADVYAMPSRGEGFGFVVLEALACGIPVVASTTDGTREAARDGLLGRLVDPDDPSALHAAIAAALSEGAGPVPEGLKHFAFSAFTERAHRVIERLWTKGAP